MKTKITTILFFLCYFFISKADIIIQAEDAKFDGSVATNHNGYTGKGFVDLGNNIGSAIEIEFTLKYAMPNGIMRVRWANGKNDVRDMKVELNGEVVITNQPFGYSGDYTIWLDADMTLNLRKGTNKVKMTSLTSVGGPNLDKFTIIGGEEGTPEFELITAIQGKGKVTRNPDVPFYEAGTVVTLTAVPDAGFQASFVGWSGDATGTNTNLQITMNAKKSVTAIFKSSTHASFYCAPKEKGGDDSNTGTFDKPFFNLTKALQLMEPGDTVYMRGGTYAYNSTINLDKFGSAAERICIFAYQKEIPVLDFYTITAGRDGARGFKITGNHYYLKGLEICYAPDNGIKVEGSYNIFELLRLHHNGDSGIQIGLAKSSPDGPDIVCFNLVKNCDSWRNLDWGTGYENADGFACKLSPGPGNRFVGCRAWQNADDGWDFYMTHYPIYIDSCWTYGNGNPEILNIDTEWKARFPNAPTSWSGDGNGFKLGGDDWAAKHQVSNCISFDGYSTGACYSENNNTDSLFLYNCVAWQGMKNFRVRKYASDLRNCISFDPKVGGEGQLYDLATGSTQMNNSWNSINGTTLVPYKETYLDDKGKEKTRTFDQKVIYDEFISTSVEDFLAPREPDGSLPKNGFGRLKSTSRFIDKGVSTVMGVSNITFKQYSFFIPYLGEAPDLGAFEYMENVLSSKINKISGEQIFSNYPNPFSTYTTFSAIATQNAHARIYICDISGKVVKTICDRYVMKGEQITEILNVDNLENGIYMSIFENGNARYIRKIVIMQ